LDAASNSASARPLKIAIFASGSGSNFQAIADRAADGSLPVRVELLVCDKPAAKVVERSAQAGISSFVFSPKDYATREAYETVILEQLRERGIELVVLAGYMRLVSSVLVQAYAGRMLNIHPSLLPSFPGLNAVRQALNHGVKVTGVTVHYVDDGLDTGPIIAQRAVEVRDDDSEKSLSERVHAVEHELYPDAIRLVADKLRQS
jgi:phosphoribosylglycinamide formyltransferase-1